MVFFTCTHCGEALKKPRVEKHFQFQCRNSISVSCMDCFKDFRGQEYIAHTKCITEAERYGGKDFVAKPGKNKGERKQQDWILIVQSVIENSKNLSSAENNILNIISNHENVPRKKAKFFNFVKSIMAGRVNMTIVENVWGKMEEAFRKASENKANGVNLEGGLKSAEESSENLSQADMVDNENNENLSKEYERAESGAVQNSKSDNPKDTPTDTIKRKSKKSKKRKVEEEAHSNAQEEGSSRSNSKIEENVENGLPHSATDEHNGIASRKSKNRKIENVQEDLCAPTTADERQNNCENIANNGGAWIEKFDWNEAILNIVRSKAEISLKKLRKKVLAEYQTSNSKTSEKLTAKFDKKINKMTQIVLVNGKVKLLT